MGSGSMAKYHSHWIVVLLTLVMLQAGSTVAEEGTSLAVVVSIDNPISNLSLVELQRIYLGKTTLFPDGQEIELIEHAQSVEQFCLKGLEMTTLRFRKHWLKLIFSGGYATPPKECERIEDIDKLLCRNVGAICFVPTASVESCMKVLTIDSLGVNDEGYVLK